MSRSPQNVGYEFVLISPAVLSIIVRLTKIVCKMGGKWPYSCCFVG